MNRQSAEEFQGREIYDILYGTIMMDTRPSTFVQTHRMYTDTEP